MTSITVQQTGFGIVVAEDGDAEATALLDGLPPLRAARYLAATPALRQALRGAEPEVVDAVRPHLDGTVVVPEDGLAGEVDADAAAGSARLALALGVSVIAPAGRFIRGDGTLFSVGGGDGWVAQSPRGGRVSTGRRYPAPAWQSQLPADLPGAAHIPAGLWITSGTDPRHAVRLAAIAVREHRLLVVAGSPSEDPPAVERILATLRSLPAGARSAIVLAGFGAGSLPLATVREVAAALAQPVRFAHGVEIGGEVVRIDGDAEPLPATLALESVCAPDGTVTLERWAPPPGLVADAAARYRLGATRGSRGRPGDTWVVDVTAAGLVVHLAGRPLADVAELATPPGSLALFVQGDGAHRPESLPALLAPLRARLEQRGVVTIHPLDAAGRRLVRDAYPGQWAPTEALAITPDGRLVAATADPSGDTDRALDADAHVAADPAETPIAMAGAAGASTDAEGRAAALATDEAMIAAVAALDPELEDTVQLRALPTPPARAAAPMAREDAPREDGRRAGARRARPTAAPASTHAAGSPATVEAVVGGPTPAATTPALPAPVTPAARSP